MAKNRPLPIHNFSDRLSIARSRTVKCKSTLEKDWFKLNARAALTLSRIRKKTVILFEQSARILAWSSCLPEQLHRRMRSSNQKNQWHTDQYLSHQQSTISFVKPVASSTSLLKTASAYFSISILCLTIHRFQGCGIDDRLKWIERATSINWSTRRTQCLGSVFESLLLSQINKVILTNLHSIDDTENS